MLPHNSKFKFQSMLFIAMLFALCAMPFAQAQTSRTIFVNFRTLSNSVTETQYVPLTGWTKIDSISLSIAATGELDVDSVDCYVGVVPPGRNADDGWYGSTAYTFVSTIDVADGVKGFANITVTGNVTQLVGSVLRGVNALKIVTRGAASGNDPTDTSQQMYVVLQVWGTK